MIENLRLATFGFPKSKKTRFAASVFESKYIDPAKVLYFDNHDSTLSLTLPKYVKKTNTGLLQTVEWDEVSKILVDIQRKMARAANEPALDMVVVDDMTEQSALSIAHLSGEAGMDIRKWGEHKVFMSGLYRRIKMVSKHTIFVCRAEWQGDPDEQPDRKQPVDNRTQKLQPVQRLV